MTWDHVYTATLDTLEQASLRPRHDGAIAFQASAAERLRQGLFNQHPVDNVLADLHVLHDCHHVPGAET